MKKFLLSLLMFGTSALYVAYQSVFTTSAVAGAKKPSLSSTQAQTTATQTTGNTSASAPAKTPVPKPQGQYKNGVYTGSVANAYYGVVQVRATISGGRITKVAFLQYPTSHSTSRYINSQAMPYLQQEAIQVQSANVSGVTGATDTSQAFRQSLGSALAQAKA